MPSGPKSLYEKNPKIAPMTPPLLVMSIYSVDLIILSIKVMSVSFEPSKKIKIHKNITREQVIYLFIWSFVEVKLKRIPQKIKRSGIKKFAEPAITENNL